MVAGEGSEEYPMNQNNRVDKRLPLQKRCILGDQRGWIGTHTVDMSIRGLGLKTNNTLPLRFKNGCELAVVIPSMAKFPQAELMWTEKDINNTTRLGLKFLY